MIGGVWMWVWLGFGLVVFGCLLVGGGLVEFVCSGNWGCVSYFVELRYVSGASGGPGLLS